MPPMRAAKSNIASGHSPRVHAWGLVVPLAAALCAGCATLPSGVERTPSTALAPTMETTLGRIVDASTPDREQSGFRLMPTGQYALAARIELARRAERTLDVQYYQIHDDRTGRYVLRTLRDAALRGVRVRLLIDDLYTAGADPLFLGLDAHANVEVRLFNPFPAGRQNLITRFAASAFDFRRVHRRMHNKLFIADGAIAVAGGRNIADEYFMVSAGANFIDLDTLVAGAIVPRLSALFDEYWNSLRTFPIEAIVPPDGAPEALRVAFDAMTGPETTPAPEPPPPNDLLGYGPIVHELDAGRLGLIWATAQAYADSPDKVIGRVYTYATVPLEDVDSVRYNVIEQIRRAREDVVVSSPYLIPGQVGLDTIREVRGRDVKFSIITNSLAATDEPVVHTGYRRYRPEMLALGVELYELSPIRVNRSLRLGRFGTSTGRLHAKSAVIDRERIFIGSMNFDPRSDRHNTELGLFIESPQLAQQTLKLIDAIMQQGTYRVRIAGNGTTLEWVVTGVRGEEILVEEPEADFWTRMMLEVYSLLAPEDLL
jgi:putative cardiolipin synthase